MAPANGDQRQCARPGNRRGERAEGQRRARTEVGVDGGEDDRRHGVEEVLRQREPAHQGAVAALAEERERYGRPRDGVGAVRDPVNECKGEGRDRGNARREHQESHRQEAAGDDRQQQYAEARPPQELEHARHRLHRPDDGPGPNGGLPLQSVLLQDVDDVDGQPPGDEAVHAAPHSEHQERVGAYVARQDAVQQVGVAISIRARLQLDRLASLGQDEPMQRQANEDVQGGEHEIGPAPAERLAERLTDRQEEEGREAGEEH